MIHMKFIGKINIYYIVLSLIIYLRQKKKHLQDNGLFLLS